LWLLGKSTIAVARTPVRLYVAWDVEEPVGGGRQDEVQQGS